jgi:hypothetical protein
MIEADVSLDDCSGVEFVSHHTNICRANGSACPDKLASPRRSGARIISFLLGNDLHTLDHVLKRPSVSDPKRELRESLDSGIEGLIHYLVGDGKRLCGAIKNPQSSVALLKGVLALYGSDQRKAAVKLVGLLSSVTVFEKALTALVNEHFGLSGWALPQ